MARLAAQGRPSYGEAEAADVLRKIAGALSHCHSVSRWGVWCKFTIYVPGSFFHFFRSPVVRYVEVRKNIATVEDGFAIVPYLFAACACYFSCRRSSFLGLRQGTQPPFSSARILGSTAVDGCATCVSTIPCRAPYSKSLCVQQV